MKNETENEKLRREVGNLKTELCTLKMIFDGAPDAAEGGRRMYQEINRFSKASGYSQEMERVTG